MKKNINWIDVLVCMPTIPDYYLVKYDDGTEDEKPFRFKPRKGIAWFMTEKKVTHWAYLK